ncbi:acyl carrier protein [Bradyrhizobium prioriisuperbiae]|uniref:acyl carrier protein n=1 Tax=Bradyrhizobium prioriisuperbiae TaxID=2854389 RepID=UPI0028E78E65|nr:acyl carrier protein [Bradyrhizobium prioritasuperba]
MDTRKKLGAIILKAIGSKHIDSEIPMAASLHDIVLSSLQFVVILGEVERIFEIVLPDEYLDPSKFDSFGSLVELVERLRGVHA